MLEAGTHRLSPLGSQLLSRCFSLNVIVIDGRVPPDGPSKLAIPAAARDAARLDVR